MGRQNTKLPYDLFTNVVGVINVGEKGMLTPFHSLMLREDEVNGPSRNIMIHLNGSPEQILFFSKALDLSIQMYNETNRKLNDNINKLSTLIGE